MFSALVAILLPLVPWITWKPKLMFASTILHPFQLQKLTSSPPVSVYAILLLFSSLLFPDDRTTPPVLWPHKKRWNGVNDGFSAFGAWAVCLLGNFRPRKRARESMILTVFPTLFIARSLGNPKWPSLRSRNRIILGILLCVWACGEKHVYDVNLGRFG